MNTNEITAWDFSSPELPFYNQLYKTALRMTRSVADTEDLMQETYLKAYRYYEGFEEGTNLKAWLFSIRTASVRSSPRRSSSTKPGIRATS
jgi:RNA polymerase sigma-70 factor (ECF subfamily)